MTETSPRRLLAALLVAAAVLLLVYPLNRAENTKIATELAERRKGFARTA